MDTRVSLIDQALLESGGSLLDMLERGLPFAGLPTFLRAPYTRDVSGADLVVMGVPFDGGCTNRPGARYGPRALRAASVYASTFQPVYPWAFDLADRYRIVDFGDVAPVPGTGAIEFMLEATKTVAAEVFEAGAGLLALGGDHTLPYGPVRAAAEKYGPVALLHFDAHQDSDELGDFWSAQEWTRGCYGAHLAPGVWTSYGPALRQPVGLIHWAGTETSPVWNGYLDGAVRSGHRAADEVLAELTGLTGRSPRR